MRTETDLDTLEFVSDLPTAEQLDSAQAELKLLCSPAPEAPARKRGTHRSFVPTALGWGFRL